MPLSRQNRRQDFSAPAGRTEHAAQEAKLKAAGDGPTFLCSQVLTRVHAHPRDDRNAEALVLAVKSSRFGCFGERRPAVERAFRLLHQSLPQ